VTMVNIVATMASMMLSAQGATSRDISSLRAVLFVGATLPANIREQTIKELCPQVYEFYGMQETGALVVSGPSDRKKRPDSVGRVIPFAEIKIVDDRGNDLEPDQIGEIIGRSPNTVTTYFNNEEKSAETFRNGWVHTGDLGSLDQDGYLTIRGRKKDMIVTGGQNVHAAEVEEIILRHPGIADCAVFGLPDDLWGERVTSLVIPRKGTTIAADELQRFCRRLLAGFKVPKEFIFEDSALPRTPTGKVQKFLLVQRFAGKN
jgi:acyl-CoA synthetase (AMP-forming)/AMP-acid ligase II